MMGHKDILKDGYEVDVICSRQDYCYLFNNSKIKRYVKNKINRRNRRKAKTELKPYSRLGENGIPDYLITAEIDNLTDIHLEP